MLRRTNKYELKNSAVHSIEYNDLDNKSVIYRCEIRIINCITARPRTQKSISHKIGLNSSIVHELICDLLLRGYIQQTRKRRLYFWHSDLFSATVEGLAMAERTKRGSWKQIFTYLKISCMTYSLYCPTDEIQWMHANGLRSSLCINGTSSL